MKTPSLSTLLLGTLLALASCGGGTGGTGSGGGSSDTVSVGVMEKGSIILNGVRYDDSTANVTIDDTPKLPADLADGMVVKVRGRVNDDRITGTAQRVEVENEVRGTVQSHNANANPPTFTVVSQTVLVPEDTVFANFAGNPTPSQAVGQLVDGTSVVEVHGLRNGSGIISASRIELIGAPGADIDELRGTVLAGTLVPDTSFTLRNGATDVAVSFGVATPITPAGATLTEGSLVEVHGNFVASTFNATRIDIEDAEDSEFQHGAGEELHFEGLVSGCPTPCSATDATFFVGSQEVQLGSNTRVEGGTREDIVDNARVEVEGHDLVGNRLVVEKLEFRRSVIRLQGIVTASGAGAFTMDVAGRSVNIETDDLTDGSVPAVSVPPINSANCVQVRGQRKAGAAVVVTAGEIRVGNCSNSSRPVIQAPVEAESPETTITLLGFEIDVSNPTDTPNQWVDINGQGITRTDFFDSVTPATTNTAGIPVPGTLVKVIFEDNGSNLVRQVELED